MPYYRAEAAACTQLPLLRVQHGVKPTPSPLSPLPSQGATSPPPLSQLCASASHLRLTDSPCSKAKLKPAPSSREVEGGAKGQWPPYLLCSTPPWEDGGDLGIAHSWRQEEAGSEFLLKSCTPAPGRSLPGPSRSRVQRIPAQSRLQRGELTRMWANGLTLAGPPAEALVIGLWLSSAQPLVDESGEKLMKLLCSWSSGFGEIWMKLVCGRGRSSQPQAPKFEDVGPWVSAVCDPDGGGCQKVDHSESTLARSRAGLGHGT